MMHLSERKIIAIILTEVPVISEEWRTRVTAAAKEIKRQEEMLVEGFGHHNESAGS